MAEIRLTGTRELQARLRALQNLGPKVMTTLGLQTVREAKLLAAPHRKTSNLEHSIHIAAQTPTFVLVVASAKYAAFLEFGTRAHIIRPRNGKALFFASQRVTTARFGAGAILKTTATGRLSAASLRKYGNAAFQYAKVVHHPGTKAAPFLAPAAREAVQTVGLADIVVQTWNTAA